MKKVFTSLFLLMFGVMASYAVRFNGTDLGSSSKTFNSSNTSIISSGTVTWNGSNRLTFDNVTITVPSSAGSNSLVYNNDLENLYIDIKGSCKITTHAYDVFRLNKQSLIQGNNVADKLIITCDQTGWTEKGVISSDENVKVYIMRMNLDITSSTTPCLSGSEKATFQISEAKVHLESTASGYAAFKGVKALTLYATYITNKGYSFNSSKGGIVGTDGNLAKETTIDGNIYFGNTICDTQAASHIVSFGQVSEGTATYYGSQKKLVLDGVKYEDIASGFAAIRNLNVDGLVIEIKGQNSLAHASETGYGIYSLKSLTIQGDGYEIGSSAQLALNNHQLGIFVDPNTGEEATLTINNAVIGAYGANYGITGREGSVDLVINNSLVIATGVAYAAINDFRNCTHNTVTTAWPSGCCWRQGLHGYGTTEGLTKGDTFIMIGVPTEIYGRVLNETINNGNYANVAADGVTEGTISYDKDNKTLTLDGVTMTAPEGSDAFGINTNVNGYTVSTIALTGTNKLTTNGHVFNLAGDVTFEGEGSLIATSNEGCGASMYGYNNNASLTINVNNTVKFFGKKYGVWGNATSSITSDLILKKAGNNSDYYFQGTNTAAVKEFGNLTMTNMDFYSGSTYGTPGCYFDDEAVRQNGGNIVNGDKVVNFYRLNDGDRYGIKIGGVEITNCNKFGVGSKYITSGGGEAVTYSGGTLTLTNATIASNDNAAVYNTDTGIEGLIVNVVGDNKLSATNDVFSFVLCKTATVTGSGTLTCNEFNAGKNSNITFKNINFTALNQIHSNQAGAKITFDLTTAGKRIKAADGVYGFNNITLANGTKIVEPEGAKVNDAGTRIETASGSLASNVVIGDASATGIEGVIMNPDAEVTGVFDGEGRQLNEMQPGVNIVRMSDGTTRKVIKK